MRSRLGPPFKPVSISHEPLVFTQSDMHESNFGVDDNGKVVLLYFDAVGLLPVSFAQHTMSSKAPFTAAIAEHLGWPPSSNSLSMSAIRECMWKVYDPSLGLDEDGNPRKVE